MSIMRGRQKQLEGIDEQYLTVQEVADILNLKVPTIRAWIHDGKLSAKKFGRAVRISRAWLQQWIDEQPNVGGGPSPPPTRKLRK